jgi:CubicO group peptidase (beta-lactamase class C family)
MDVRPLPEELRAFARDEIARLQVPGASVGVLYDGVIYAGGVGVTNVEHPLPVTAETLFQIGSTSKTVTATALMQLVEEQRVDLDATVRAYLPDFRLQSESDAARLTVRDLVTHHTGYVGDYFRDTGRGDDAIARIVAKMANSPQLVPAGSLFSYSNAAFYVLSHIIQTIRGKPFEDVIRERVFVPLGMRTSFYFPEDCMTYRVATGHIVTREGPKIARRWHMWRSGAGGGGVISNAVDQMRYAALHVGIDHESVLSSRGVVEMQRVQRAAGSMCEAIGISWMLDHAGVGHRLVKHGGATNGHLSSFELVPSKGFAVSVLTNADAGRETRQTVADRAQRLFLGFDKPEPREAQGLSPDMAQYEGAYHATLEHLQVTARGKQLHILGTPPPRFIVDPNVQPIPLPPATLSFTGVDEASVLDGPRKGERVEFLRDADGRIEWLRWDGRIARKEPQQST